MPWDASPGAGFTFAEPWLPLNLDWRTRNIASETADPASMLRLTRRLIALRRASPALTLGDYVPVSADDGVLVYERRAEGQRMLIALNFTDGPRAVTLPAGEWQVVCSTATHTPPLPRRGRLELAADEGVTLRLGDL
jgi:glycosidase